jgi:hypothetical protein
VQLRYSMPREPAAEWRMQAADHKLASDNN